MQIFTQYGNWPNDSYFKKWEINNANSNTESSCKPILTEIKKLQTFQKKDSKLPDTKNDDTGIFSEQILARKWDLTHLIARASIKATKIKKELLPVFSEVRSDGTTKVDDLITKACLGYCNTMLILKFDNVPKNNSKNMVGGIDLKEFEDHIVVMKKNDDSLNTTGYEYMSKEKGLHELRFLLEDIVEQRQDIYKTTYIVAQIYKKEKMDIFGNLTKIEL